jgi:serine palmitoyltransferase
MAKGEHGGENPITWFSALTTYLGYATLIVFGHLRDFVGKSLGRSRYKKSFEAGKDGYAPFSFSFDNFFTRRMYHRIQDCFNRPFTGPPGAQIRVVERESADGVIYESKGSESTKKCLNLGSYNYLGFADDWNNTCKDFVFEAFDHFSTSSCSTRLDCGTNVLHKQLEQKVADFVGKESSFVFNMGYGTNSTVIPALMGAGSLVVSDSLNHASIVNGARGSGAVIRVFRHNNAEDLEKILREAIVDGQPRTRRPWTKILVMVEGVYSMEGEICDLKSIVNVAKKFKAYLYVDEAHSIGAVGKTGRGVCQHCGVDPDDVDILMGTFTKSFGGMGGYIASSREFVEQLKRQTSGSMFSTAMSPIICKQVIRAFDIIDGNVLGTLGQEKLDRVKKNSDYFRDSLIAMGCEVFGDTGSPVIPLMLYNPTKIAAFSRECYKRGLAVVVVGFPATPVVLSRARFCISAGHTRAQLDDALQKIEEIANILKIKYRKNVLG